MEGIHLPIQLKPVLVGAELTISRVVVERGCWSESRQFMNQHRTGYRVRLESHGHMGGGPGCQGGLLADNINED